MPNLLGNILSSYQNGQTEAKPNYIRLISILFAVFLIIGLVMGYIFSRVPNNVTPVAENEVPKTDRNLATYEGVVTYIEPFMYQTDEIKYSLLDSLGNEIILLKARDQKLEVSEGHHVIVNGTVKKLTGGKGEYLLVENLVIKNATN